MLSALFPDVRSVVVIEYFLLHEQNELNQKDLCDALKIYPAPMAKILHQLEWIGLIRETRRIAKSRFYKLDKTSRLIEPLRALMDEFNHEYAVKFAKENKSDIDTK